MAGFPPHRHADRSGIEKRRKPAVRRVVEVPHPRSESEEHDESDRRADARQEWARRAATLDPAACQVAWFADPDTPDAWLVVASGGDAVDPDWYQNLMAHPDRAALEMHGQEAAPVAPAELTGPDRDDAWQRIVTAMPRLAKYQSKSDRQYPVIRLSAR